MAYKQKKYTFPNAIEVEQYHTARYGNPNEPRVKRKKATPEDIERVNQYNKEKLCRRKLRTWFKVDDYFTSLTYRREERPLSMDGAKKDFQVFMRKVRREYKKRGCELRWIRNIECGSKGGWHIHLAINRIPDTDIILTKCWTLGRVTNQLMFAKGEFAKLAAYLTKTPKTDKRLRESDYSASRNLPVKEPKEKVYKKWKTWKKIRVPKGFYLDEESIREGINPVTGYPYRSYTLIRIVRRE